MIGPQPTGTGLLATPEIAHHTPRGKRRNWCCQHSQCQSRLEACKPPYLMLRLARGRLETFFFRIEQSTVAIKRSSFNTTTQKKNKQTPQTTHTSNPTKPTSRYN